MLWLKDGLNEYVITIDNIGINYFCDFKSNSMDMIVFLHGLGCSKETFRYVFDKQYFPDKTLLIPDLAGFGKTSKPENFSYSIEDQACLIEKLILLFPVINLHIVAHSMGGAVALLFSPETTLRIKTFANAEGNLIKEDCGLMSRGIANSSFDEYEGRIFKEQQIEFENNKQLRLQQSTAKAMYRSARSLVEWSDSGELLERFLNLNCKKCYIWGEENHDMSILQRLGSISKIMIHNSGHGMMTDNPEEYYSVLKDFINPPN